MNFVDSTERWAWDGIRDVTLQAFSFDGGTPESRVESWDRYVANVGRENFSGYADGRTIVGALCVFRAGQWFGGAALPMAGIAAVGVSPAHRGRGVAYGLMSSRLRLAAEEGFALATLYASTQGPYRKVGFEQAGSCARWSMPCDAAPDLGRALPIEEVSPEEPMLRGLHRMRGLTTPGTVDRSEAMWERIATERGHPVYAWLLGTRDDPQGYVVYERAKGDTFRQRIEIRDAVALTPLAVRRLWTLLYDHRSMVGEVAWRGPVNEPLVTVLPEQRTTTSSNERWLLRIVDVTKALSLRGYPADADAELHLEITDSMFAANHGRFILRVAGGKAEVTSGGRGDLQAPIGGLAPLYSGLLRAADLARLGLLDGSAQALAAADRLFSGPEPWMSDRF